LGYGVVDSRHGGGIGRRPTGLKHFGAFVH